MPGHGYWFWRFCSKVKTPGDVPDCRGKVQMKSGKPDMAIWTQEVEGGLGNMHAREFPVVGRIAGNGVDA